MATHPARPRCRSIRGGDVADAGKVPVASHQHQIDLALAVGEQDAPTLIADERNLPTTADRPHAHLVVRNEPEDAVVVGRRGDGNLANTADDNLRRHAELFADGIIKRILQVALVGLASIQATLGNFVAGGIAPLKRLLR
jgi:hypothetical protein